MKTVNLISALCLALLLTLLVPEIVQAQEPILQSTHPVSNTVTAGLTTTISATYNQEMDATTVTSVTLAIHGMQSGLVTETHGVINNGHTLIVTPTYSFFPGELVYAIATTRTTNITGTASLSSTQWQFNAGVVSHRCVGNFTEDIVASPVLTDVGMSSAVWGDYDNDGDLDILLTGMDSNMTPVAKIYRNTSGSFVEDIAASSVLTDVGMSSAVWGDYDNDGDVDILLTGLDSSLTPVAKIYKNTGGGFAEDTVASAALTGVYNGSVAWGDYDNDGDLDILLTGQTATTNITEVYQNTGSGFSLDIVASSILTGVVGSSVAWGDYDNDGDLDILLTGQDNNYTSVTSVYQNTGNGFSEDTIASTNLSNVYVGSVAWGDYDNDGDLDILLTGVGNSTAIAGVYQNTNGNFNEVYAGALTGVVSSSTVWGDYDNDGDLDIFLTGIRIDNVRVTKIYQNTGSGFNEVHANSLLGVNVSSVAWGDYDNDDDLDILLTGYINNFTPITKLYRNDDCIPVPKVNGIFPISNTVTADLNTSIAISYSHPMSASTVTSVTFAVHGMQSGLVTETHGVINGGTLQVVPNHSFFQGELVYAIATTHTTNITGTAPLSSTQWQFNAGVVDKHCVASFSDIGAGLSEVMFSSVAWGDYDNDGDLDILLAGQDSSVARMTKVYQNTGSGFSDIGAGLPGISNGSVAWGDYDNDGDLDILLAGWNITRVYRNTGSGFTIDTPASVDLPDVERGSAVWGDADNDGDLDVLLTGDDGTDRIARVYRNTGSGFTDIGAGLTGVENSSAVWGDYDNDGDIDILLTGYMDSGPIADIYENTDNGFVKDITASADLLGVYGSSVAWGDYDNDNDLDILLTGYDDSNPISKVYENTGGGFTDIGAGLTGINFGSVAWGDYDNDGDLDILLTGRDSSLNPISKVYENTGSGFSQNTPVGLPNVRSSSIAWGDYDNDNDLDILLTGYDEKNSRYVSGVYRNDDTPCPPEVETIFPISNTITADVDTPIAITYSHPMNASTVTSVTFAIHGMQSGLVTEAHGVVNGNTLQVTPNRSFFQGELVYAIATTHTTNITGTSPWLGTQWQFNAGEVRNRCVGGFSDIGADLPAVIYSSAAWGDYDNDQDLDIFLTGMSGSQGIARLYENTGSGFSEDIVASSVITDMNSGSVTWGDYDNDGDVDLLLTGNNNIGIFAKIYQNTNGSFSEDIVATESITGVRSSSAAWGDYDNDGDLDILLAGENNIAGRITKVYQNTGNGFSDIDAGLPGVEDGSVAWGDYDGDYDLDILLTGRRNAGRTARVYENTGNGFTDIGAGLIGVDRGQSRWGDYDNDGDLDILLTGMDGSLNKVTKIYENTSAGFVEDTSTGLPNIGDSRVDWGDYDNDGDLDILLGGWDDTHRIARVYRNTGSGFEDIDAGLDDATSGAVIWGDYDNDGDLDILLTGLNTSTGNGRVTSVFRNDDTPCPPEVEAFFPISNIITANLDTPIAITYSHPMSASSVTSVTFAVHGMQSGLVTEAHGVVNGNTLQVTPNRSFFQGELVYAIATTHTTNITGTSPWQGTQWQFNAGEVRNRCVGGFSDIGADLPAVIYSSAAWGDYDNDQDLDIFLTGMSDSQGIARLYENTGSGFSEDIAASSVITDMNSGSVTWGDYDNDGDVDLLLTGNNNIGIFAKIYQNTNGSFSEDIVATESITGVRSSSAAWGDYDNDGDLDILLTGYNNIAGRMTKVYQNTNGSFSDINAGLPGVEDGSVTWGDYDGDYDLDILLTGRRNSGRTARVYENTDSGFIDIEAGLTPVDRGQSRWGDYDNDGDLDILLTGMDGSLNKVTKIYENTSAGFVEDTSTGLPNIGDSRVDWGDYDNDGDLDILLGGWDDTHRIARVYRNTGSGFEDMGVGLDDATSGAVIWGDYDNDGDLDILLTGLNTSTGNGRVTRVFRNDDCAPEVESLFPLENTVNANLDTTIAITYSEPMNASTVTSVTFAIHGMQSGLVTETHGIINGNTLQVVPNRSFFQGELVYAIATTHTANITGTTPIWGTQWQFNAGDVRNRCMGGFSQDIQASSVLTGVQNSSVAWGDYDNDGDLDILLTGGDDSNTPLARVYQNTGSGFSDIGAGLPGVYFSSAAWGDYDNDGDLDILLSGADGGGTPLTALYQNTGSGFSLNATASANLTDVWGSSVAWGDYDNDGDLDIILAGSDGSDSLTRIYQNTGSGFIDIEADLSGVISGNVAWGDYDNDGDLDVLLTGTSSRGRIAWVYSNTAGRFRRDKAVKLPGVMGGSAVWGDYDGDLDLDILLTGLDEDGNRMAEVYENTGSGFTAIGAGLPGVLWSRAAWGDYDNDGDLDILLAGYISGGYSTTGIYQNTGSGFTQDAAASTDLTDLFLGSVAWGDYDNDDDLDILLTGDTGSNAFAGVYRNNDCPPIYLVKTATARPNNGAALYHTPITYTVILTNSNSSDAAGTLFTDTLPANVDFAHFISPPTPNSTTENSGIITWNGTVTASSAITFSYVVTHTGNYEDVLSNRAELLYPTTGQSDTVSALVTIATPPDLAITKQVTPTHVYPGWPITYTLTFSNIGGNPATNITITDRVPVSLTNISVISSTDFGGTISNTGATPAYVWTISEMPAESSGIITITGVLSNPLAPHTFTNTAKITTSSDDSEKANNKDSADVTVNFDPPPTLQHIYPASNSITASLATTITATYDQAMKPSSVTSITFAVHGMQSGLVTQTHGVVNGNTLQVTPNHAFHQGELVYAIATNRTTNITGTAQYSNTQWQFNAGVVSNRCVGGFSLDIEASNALTDVRLGSVAWGDYDGDNDLDILSTGLGSSFASNIYENMDSGFSDIGAGLPGIAWSSVAWGDYDNDGDLDVLLTGAGSGPPITRIYENTDSGFTDIGASLPDVVWSSAAWGDYDNDGDLDILLTGESSGRIARVYENTGSGFTDIGAGLPGVRFGSVAWGDYDNDGDLDILLAGDSSSGRITRIYQNTSSGFVHDTVASADLPGVQNGSVAWGDYDNDGDLDILLTGNTGSTHITDVYENTGSGFSDIGASLLDVADSSVAWGDYDNDGDLDILLTGERDTGNRITRVYENTGSGFSNMGAGLPGVSDSSVAWGDYDNDGDLDILLTGDTGSTTPLTRIYRNDECPPEMDVQGNGQSIPNNSTLPKSSNDTDFGVVIDNSTVVHTFIISNSGRGDLTLTGTPTVALTTNTHFSVTQHPAGSVGSNMTTTFKITFDPLTAGSFTDTVSIANNDSDNDPYTFVISGTGIMPILTINKTAMANPNKFAAEYHSTITYTVKLTNSGNGNAMATLFTDTLPAEVDFARFISPPTPNDAVINNDIITWNGAVTANSVITFSYVVTHADAYNDTFSNNAEFLHATTSQSDTVSTTVTIANTSDLAITKNVTPIRAIPGQTITYTLSFSNSDGNMATGIVITDSIPVSLTNISVVSSTNFGGTIVDSGATPTYVWNVSDMAVGDSGLITITAQISNPLAAHVFTNTAIIDSVWADNNSANNSSSANVTVLAHPMIEKHFGPDSITINSTSTLTFVLTNTNGSTTLNGLNFTDTFPTGLQIASSPNLGGSCNGDTVSASDFSPAIVAGGTAINLQASAGYSLAANSDCTITVDVVGISAGAKTNTSGNIGSAETVAGTDNASDTLMVTGPILAIDKTATANPSTFAVEYHGAITYTVRLTNSGDGDALNTLFTDTLPSDVEFARFISPPTPGSTAESDGVITWNGTVTANSVITFSYVVTHVGAYNDVFSNNAKFLHATTSQSDTASAAVIIATAPEVSISKTATPANVVPGETVTYTLNFNNSGGSTATGIVITDRVPVSLTNISVVSSTDFGGTIVDSGAAPAYVWNVSDMAVGDSGLITITGEVDQSLSAGGRFTNTAQIDSNGDSTTANNSSAVGVNILQANLVLTKNSNILAPSPGQTITYTIEVANQGPDAVSGIVVSDTLPISVTYQSDTPSSGTYDETNGVWSGLSSLAAGSSHILEITVVVTDVAGTLGQTIVNTAVITEFRGINLNSNDDDDSVSLTVRDADLHIDKSVNTTSPREGETITYTVVITNNGPDSAAVVTVTDFLPTYLTFADASATQGSYNDATGTWVIDTVLSQDEVAILTLVATVNSGTAGQTVVNIAYVSDSTEGDSNNLNNASSAIVAVQEAELAVSKVVAGPGVAPAETIQVDATDQVTYTVTVVNNGPDILPAGTVVSDTLSDDLTLQSIIVPVGNGSAISGNPVIWTLPQLNVGQSVSVTILANVQAGTAGQTLLNTAAISSATQGDSDILNNSDVATITVSGADLELGKHVSPAIPAEGEDITYTIVVTNHGPDTAGSVVVSDTLPAGITYGGLIAGYPSHGSYSAGVWTVNDLNNSDVATLIFTATADAGTAGQTLTNTAAISSTATEDGNTANNEDSATLTVESFDLSINKTAQRDNEASANGIITYTVTVANFGTTAAPGAIINDLIPADITGFSWTCAESGGATCPNTSGSGAINETTGEFPTGGQLIYTVQATMVSSDTVVTNTVTVTSLNGQGDIDASNNSATNVSRPGVVLYFPIIFSNFDPAPDLVVDDIVATSSAVTVTIRNAGASATPDDFWVDFYFNPNPAPPPINKTWNSISTYGGNWGVTERLSAGESLVLVTGGQYYADGSAAFPAGMSVYAYVDSINHATNHGNILESNEDNNNTFGPVISTTGAGGASAPVGSLSVPASLPQR